MRDQLVGIEVVAVGGDDHRTAHPLLDARVDGVAQRGSGNGDHRQTDLLRHVGDRRMGTHAADGLVCGIHRVDGDTGVIAHVGPDGMTDRTRNVGGTDDRDRGREQEPCDGP